MAEQYADLTFMHRRVPEAATVDASFAGASQAALDDAEPMIEVSVYGALAELAHAYYAGHLLACAYPVIMGGEQGPPVSLGKDAISASFAVTTAPGQVDDPATTKYGRLYMQQRKLASPRAGRVAT